MDYGLLNEQLKALTAGVPNKVTNLANAAALLYNELDEVNWTGFYIAEGDVLWLGPFMGKPACVSIPFGKGVCGTAAVTDKTQLVPYVHNFAGHIVCDTASNAEIVIPLHDHGRIYGVLDVDSHLPGRFNAEDQAGLELFARTLEKALFGD